MNKFIWILCTIFMVGCATKNPQSTKMSIQDKWELITLDGKEVSTKQAVVLELDDNNMISGTTGCNQVSGSYTVDNNSQITFNQLALTRMMCEENQMQIESDVMDMLETVNNFTIDGDILSLNVGKRAPLATFHRLSKSELVGRYWKLIELDGKTVKMADNQEQEQYFIMRSDGTLHGFAGCNLFNGNFTLNSENMQIEFDSNMAMTMRNCPDVQVDEQALMQVFEDANNYTISDNKLYLNIGRRAPLAVFEAVTF